MLPYGLAPSTFGLAEFPKSTRGHDRDALEISQNEQIFVACYNSAFPGETKPSTIRSFGSRRVLGSSFSGIITIRHLASGTSHSP